MSRSICFVSQVSSWSLVWCYFQLRFCLDLGIIWLEYCSFIIFNRWAQFILSRISLWNFVPGRNNFAAWFLVDNQVLWCWCDLIFSKLTLIFLNDDGVLSYLAQNWRSPERLIFEPSNWLIGLNKTGTWSCDHALNKLKIWLVFSINSNLRIFIIAIINLTIWLHHYSLFLSWELSRPRFVSQFKRIFFALQNFVWKILLLHLQMVLEILVSIGRATLILLALVIIHNYFTIQDWGQRTKSSVLFKSPGCLVFNCLILLADLDFEWIFNFCSLGSDWFWFRNWGFARQSHAIELQGRRITQFTLILHIFQPA